MTFAVQNGGYPPGFLIGGPMVNGIPVGGGSSSNTFNQFPTNSGFASSQALGGAGFQQSNLFPTPGIIGAQPQTFSSGTFVPSGFSGSGIFQSTLPGSGNLASMFGAPVGTEAALLKMQNSAQFEQNLGMQQMQAQGFSQQQALMQQQALAQQAAMQQTMMQQQAMMQGQGQYFPQQQILPQQQQDSSGMQMMQMLLQMFTMMMTLFNEASQQKTA